MKAYRQSMHIFYTIDQKSALKLSAAFKNRGSLEFEVILIIEDKDKNSMVSVNPLTVNENGSGF